MKLLADSRRAARQLLRAVPMLVSLLFAWPAAAANYPLELVSPRAVGTAPAAGNAAITATNRIYKAYPGLEYNIRAVVLGGAYPYRFAISNAPAGMTINENTGLIVWPNPQANASPTITVTDSEGTRASSQWSIAVTTAGFHFVDAINGRNYPLGTGTAANPWRSILDIMTAPEAGLGGIVYFKSGTYSPLSLPHVDVGGPWERVGINGNSKPVIWIAYPGQTPVIDFGFVPGVSAGVLIRFSGSNVYLDGLETHNSRIIGFQLSTEAPCNYRVIRRMRMRDHNLIEANLDGSNASYIMFMSNYSDSTAGGNAGSWAQYTAIQDNDFQSAPADMAIKAYSQWKLLIEDNFFRGLRHGTELKADLAQFTYRHNSHIGLPGRNIAGNMHSYTTHGEILFNLVLAPMNAEAALDINQDGQAKRIDIYRNTVVGRIRVRNTDAADGPFVFSNNVFVSNDAGTPSGSHIYNENVSATDRLLLSAQLAGYPSANIVDSSGSLTAQYQEYLGSRGYQLGDATNSIPSPPTSFVVE